MVLLLIPIVVVVVVVGRGGSRGSRWAREWVFFLQKHNACGVRNLHSVILQLGISKKVGQLNLLSPCLFKRTVTIMFLYLTFFCAVDCFEFCSNVQLNFWNFALFQGDPLELICQYYDQFGDKPCCFSDLQLYVALLNESEKQQVRVNLISLKLLFCQIQWHSEWGGGEGGWSTTSVAEEGGAKFYDIFL